MTRKPPEGPLPPPIPGVDRYVKEVAEVAGDWSWGAEEKRTTAKPARLTMTPYALEIAARMKELFYSYVNRNESDNRSAQATLGPSEIGHPCDRRLAMSLLRIPPVNPPRYDWASWIGTCVHGGLAEMFEWANQGSGRFATEVPLTYPTSHVPRGTTDLLDRVLYISIDHKVLGSYSLDKFRTVGPPLHYRVQVHTYALGLKIQGEEIRKVAIIVWPRERSSLDDLWVWEEDYDPNLAREALERVDRIAAKLRDTDHFGGNLALQIGQFPIDNSDCKFCPFFKAGSTDLTRGCNGRA